MYNSKLTHSELYVQITKHFTDIRACFAKHTQLRNNEFCHKM